MSFRTPVSKVRGLGSAKHGLEHWWTQRLTALMLIPLGIWFITSIIRLTNLDHLSIIDWLVSPFNSALLIFFVIALFHHAQLGIQVVIEDYIHSDFKKIASLIVIKCIAMFCTVIAILSIIKIYLGL